MALLVLLGVAGWLWLFEDLPAWDSLSERLHTPSVRIVDRNGRLLYEVLDEKGGRHVVVPVDSIPLACRQAAIATEDRRFYTHPGVDLEGVLRAVWINLRGGEALAGGSTITQQVARNLLLDDAERGERSLRRKLREAFLAWRITNHYTKDEVLALYLNQTYYGGMAYGLEAAAQTFFGKPAAQLDLAECALLAGLPQAPAIYNPYTDQAAARARQSIVLRLMEQDGYITTGQRQLAEREALILAEKPYPIEAPHFVMMVRAKLDGLFSPQEIYQHGGLVVRTTLDLDWQKLAEETVLHHLEQLQHSEDGLGHNVTSAALIALDPSSGEILALVGSPDYFDGVHAGAINMALAPRQPGSAIKPLVYAAALDPSGPGGWTAATMLLDVNTSFITHEGQAYIPANYDQREHGPVLVREALASSLNIPAVLTLRHVGMENFSSLAKKVGISTLGDPHTYDLSLALGGGEVRLIDLTAAYAVFSNRGYSVTPQFILDVQDFNGNQLYQPAVTPQLRLLDERLTWLISDILSDPDARRLGFGANSLLRLDRPAAVKTGTTSNFHDNWTVGYTPDLVVGVWSGNTDYQPMRDVNGLSGAAPIWHQFMRAALADHLPQQFIRPPGMVQIEVCRLSGLLPTQACPYRRLEWFIDGTQPEQADHFYQEVTIDQTTGKLASQATPLAKRLRQVVLNLPPQALPWARAQGLPTYSDLISSVPAVLTEQSSADLSLLSLIAPDSSLALLSPASGSIYRLSPAIDGEVQRVRLEAASAIQLTQLTLWVDDVQISRLDEAPYQAWWTLTPGIHRAWAEGILPDGRQVASPVVSFTVLR